MKEFYNKLIETSKENIIKLVQNSNGHISERFYTLAQFEPNSIERKTWTSIIIQFVEMDKCKAKEYTLHIEFYKETYNFSLSEGDTFYSNYRRTITKIITALAPYHNKENLHIIPNKKFFNNNELYDRYKYFCDLEDLIYPYIYEIKYFFDESKKEIRYKVLVKSNVD